MPITYHIEPDAGMLFIFGEGTISQRERMTAMRAWLGDKAFRPGLKTLCDFSAAISIPTLAELLEISRFIEEHAARIGQKKLAMVMRGAAASGVARQFRLLVAGTAAALDVQVFDERPAAVAWLQEAGR